MLSCIYTQVGSPLDTPVHAVQRHNAQHGQHRVLVKPLTLEPKPSPCLLLERSITVRVHCQEAPLSQHWRSFAAS